MAVLGSTKMSAARSQNGISSCGRCSIILTLSLFFNFSLLTLNFAVGFVGGTEKDRAKVKVKSEKLKNKDNVKIIEHRPHDEIPFWLRAADILVLPNTAIEDISKYYTSPMKLFEYMASGRPIVPSDLP